MTFSYDFQETEEYGDFVTLTPGRYIFALTKVKKDVSAAGNPKAVVTLAVVAGGNDAYIGGIINQHWPTSGAGAFRFRAMLKALGVNVKDRGKVALEKYIDDKFGARVTLQEGKEKNEAGETVWFHELNAILPPSQYADLLEEDEDEEYEDEEEETEEAEEEETEEDEDEEDEGVSVEDLDEMSLVELKELAEDWEISTKPDKGKKKLTMAQMRRRLAAFIEEAEDEDEGEDEDEEEEEGEDVLTVDDLDNMDLAELREVAKDNEVKLRKPPKGKKQTAARVRKTLVEALFADEDEGDNEEPF
ncbi:hypothetical protein LCGC14_1097320 [marine sediment metagenome]|uniref:Uncharacterized protein n=1 Tax=marine sediment metagenome TaxID=412755 RepID=A0A0F9MEZ1_9ZZZZ